MLLELGKRDNTGTFRVSKRAEVSPEVVREYIATYGVQLVAEWQTGGSDAIGFDIHSEREFWQEFPVTDSEIVAKPAEVKAFFAGKLIGFEVRRWRDSETEVVDTLQVPTALYDDAHFVEVEK